MADKISLQKDYSALNERLAKLFDESGVKRSFTIPYIEGQPMADHISAVGQVAAQSGGMTNNLITSAHHSTGKGYGSGDGHTVAHPAEKLRTTVIPAKDENAKACIDACQKYLDDIGHLIGEDDPTVVTANSQLKLVKKHNGQAMSLYDFGVFLIQLTHPPTQAVAQRHNDTKKGGAGHPTLKAPEAGSAPAPESGQEAPESDQGGSPEGEQAPEGQEAAPEAPAAPEQAQG
jgi:hypothetical protein